jgi:hypothetical protein
MYIGRPKNLTPWRDSNPGSSVLDAMTTMPRRQDQSDLIGRIFAYWAIVFPGKFIENYRSSAVMY